MRSTTPAGFYPRAPFDEYESAMTEMKTIGMCLAAEYAAGNFDPDSILVQEAIRLRKTILQVREWLLRERRPTQAP